MTNVATPALDAPLDAKPLPRNLEAARDELRELRQAIRAADLAYHQHDAPKITDPEYDALVRRERAVAAAFPNLSVSERPVGAPPSTAFPAIHHLVPMLSLANAFSLEDAAAFYGRARDACGPSVRFVCEHKIDGLSLSLTYRNRRLDTAATRGDGTEGEDVTPNAATIPDIPHALPDGAPDLIEIRGEVYMAAEDFAAANERRTETGKEPFANLRNAAAGTLRNGNPEETRRRRLRFRAYGLGHASVPVADGEEGLLAVLASWGFDTPRSSPPAADFKTIVAFHAKAGEERPALGFDIDGTVVKVENFAQRQALGSTGREPRWAVAIKFPAARAQTPLKAILIQVGRSGVLTPVADLDPVIVGGVEVSRATLHNEATVRRLDLRPGDLVTIERAGDVIPKVIGRAALPGEDADAPRPGTRWTMPETCPACGCMAVRDPGGAAVRCTNGMSCEATTLARFARLVGRDVLDIEGLAGKKLADLLTLKVLRTPADLYRLHRHRALIERAPGWGAVSVAKLLQAVEACRSVPLDRLLISFGIREVGHTASRLIAERYRTAGAALAVMRASAADALARRALTDLPGMGPVMAGEVAAWFSQAQNVEALDDLLTEISVVDLPTAAAPTGPAPLAGKVVVFTGTLSTTTRDAAEARARELGATTSGSVSAKTSILVAGDKAGSKRAKADELNRKGASIQVLDEDGWNRLAGA